MAPKKKQTKQAFGRKKRGAQCRGKNGGRKPKVDASDPTLATALGLAVSVKTAADGTSVSNKLINAYFISISM